MKAVIVSDFIGIINDVVIEEKRSLVNAIIKDL